MQKATYVMIFKRVTSRLQPLIKLTPSFTVNRNNTIKQRFYWGKQVIISTVQTIPKWRLFQNGGIPIQLKFQNGVQIKYGGHYEMSTHSREYHYVTATQEITSTPTNTNKPAHD